jgi:hypothetical protein
VDQINFLCCLAWFEVQENIGFGLKALKVWKMSKARTFIQKKQLRKKNWNSNKGDIIL